MTRVHIEHRRGLNCEDARDLIKTRATGYGTQAWIITQSFTAFGIEKWEGELPPGFEDMFQGRIFCQGSEVRWIREGDEWEIWQILEPADGELECAVTERRYYLWGIYHPDSGAFLEDRIPRVPAYPVQGTPRDQGRAFIVVKEYSPLPVGDLPEKDGHLALTDELNRPPICTHRFVRLACDEDGRAHG